MGNSSSTNVFLSVNESARIGMTAGSTISGEIRCPDRSITNDLFSGVTLYFIGKEDVKVVCSSSGHGSHGGKAKANNAKRDIVRSIIPLDTSKRAVEAGRYPFSFQIPDQLPSSMYFKDGNGGFCSIRYKVKLHLLRGRDQEVPIEIVAKPPSTAPVPSVADPRTARIQFLCCIPQGSLTWAAGVGDTRLGIGENLSVHLGMKNESRAKFETVTVKLKQEMEWHASGHYSTEKTVIRSSSFSKIPSMRARSKNHLRLINSQRSVAAPDAQTTQPLSVYEEVLDSIEKGNNTVIFQIPESTHQSYTGRLLKIHHYISIKAQTSSCYSSPKIHIPIEITSPRDTPIVTAQVIPMPSAPPLLSDSEEYLGASYLAELYPDATATFVIDADATINEARMEEEIVLGYDEGEPLPVMPSEDRVLDNHTTEPPQPAFGTQLIEPLLARDCMFDSGRV